jgi:hypothetical protein
VRAHPSLTLAFAAVSAVVTAIGVLSSSACRHDDDSVRAEVQRLALAEGDEALRQAERIARFGRQALPPVEAALHTAEDAGRKNLVVALRRIGDAEAVPLLLHVAAYDGSESARREAEWTLAEWAKGEGVRADRARAAMRRLDELREREAAG